MVTANRLRRGRVNGPASAKFTIGAEASNAITVNVQLRDERGKDLAGQHMVDWFISDDSSGNSLAATAPDGGVAGGTDGWVSSTVTGKRGQAVCEADGDLDIVITHAAGAKTVYLGLRMPDGRVHMSSAITFA